MAKEVMTDRVVYVADAGLEIIKLSNSRGTASVQNTAVIVTNRSHGKNACCAWRDLQIDSQTSRQQRSMPFLHDSAKLPNQLKTGHTILRSKLKPTRKYEIHEASE
jgi:hypothetical protein